MELTDDMKRWFTPDRKICGPEQIKEILYELAKKYWDSVVDFPQFEHQNPKQKLQTQIDESGQSTIDWVIDHLYDTTLCVEKKSLQILYKQGFCPMLNCVDDETIARIARQAPDDMSFAEYVYRHPRLLYGEGFDSNG